MNPLEINNEQKIKLEEMIKKLFPEFKWIKVDEHQIDGGFPSVVGVSNTNYNPTFVYLNETNSVPRDGYRCIPWLEFCLTSLQYKLYNILYFRKATSLGIDTWNQNLMEKLFFHKFVGNGIVRHPIDYLYEEFKKLKQYV